MGSSISINNALFIISPFLAVYFLFVIFKLKKILKERKKNREGNYTFLEYFIFFNAITLTAYFSCLIIINYLYADYGNVPLEIHIKNLIFIIFFTAILLIQRWWFESKESVDAGNAPPESGILDLIVNVIIFSVCYTSIFQIHTGYIITGYFFAILNVARVIKFRIYDDHFVYKVLSPNSKRYLIKNNEGHTLLRGILDMLPRAYLYTAFSFTIFQLLSMDNPMYGLCEVKNDAFVVSNPSGNPFADFFYFNVMPIGYGDISPKSALAKLICIFEVMFVVIILGAISSTIIGRFLAINKDKENN